ncbi:hypothetical protein Y032_0433g1368 [Ancylostoma ceylanicum]|uniref:Calponin-homology (CH) domain-containing protein n=1 Tax=Ancylostoma ceylanicum TaxID=53326 RepID=A0A016WZK7_9BILA|nr:hypothetical protein Y032_0433g1368 [Ancylostoma ceylanicum]
MPLFGLRISAQDEDERAQKNTFTRWINLHLEEHSSSGRVNDLFEDIKDGVLLCHLIEVLTGEALQVCSPRVSKRVHHIANLTTALTVLRRRGLELVNNNASDIADGNPRIVLGLIWQIILHFQIETNMALLREWGWGSTSVQYSRETTPVRSPSSPIRSRLASLLSSGPSTSAESPKVSVKQMKSSVEQVMLRWINAEVAQRVNLRVENMDRDWKDGVMFSALVHRWKPDVIDMEKVRAAEPRENLENAFELAQKHLGIKRLLEVDDVLFQKPDKRSIITYVSQFIRAFGDSPPVEEPNVYAEFLEWLSHAYKLDLVNSEQGMYFRLRREFIEYRSVFNTIMATKLNFTVGELTEIQERWEIVRSNLEAAAASAEKRLPKPYSTLSAWTVTGQTIINTPLNLPSEDPHKCLTMLQKMISEHNRHFIEMAAKQEELGQATETGGLGGRPVAAEYVEPLRVRMAALAEEAPLKLATLKVLHAHYTVLAYLHDLEVKMNLWRSAESLQLLNRWIAEYNQLESENPRAKSNHNLETLRKTFASEPPTKLDAEGMMKTCSRRSDETLKAFESLKPKLQTLLVMWTEWETELLRLEDIAKDGIANRTNTMRDEMEAIRTIESKYDELVPLLSASARLASNQRLELLRMKVRHLSRFAATSRLVVDLVPSTSQKISKVTNVSEATASVQDIERNLRERSSAQAGSELQEGFEKMEMKRRLTSLRTAMPKMNAVEHYLEQLQEWLRSPDAYDRSKALDILDQLEKEIDTIEREAAPYVDCRFYRERLQICTAKLHGEGTSSTKNYPEPPIDKDYVKEVIARAELILTRRETNEDEVRASLNDMEDCNAVLRDWSSKRLDELRQRWEAKRREFELWEQSMDRIRQIDDSLQLSKPVESSEVGEELVTFCPQLDERHTEARRILHDKMELFRRLQNYYDAMKYLRNQNIAWNTITVAEIPKVSAELETLVERCDSEWENDALRLRADLLAISGSFFQLEFDRINEKLNLLTFEKEKLRDLMRIRLKYLDAARDFITSTDSSIDVTQMATPSDRHPDVENLTKDLCKNLEEKAERLRQLQDQAEMAISDLAISQLLKKFRRQLVGIADENTFDDAARNFESLITDKLPIADDPLQFLTIILQLKKQEEIESKAFEEVNELASADHEKTERDRLAAMYGSRQEQRKQLTLEYMYSYHDYLNALFHRHEDKAVQLINNRALEELQTFNDGEWKQWKEAVGELESVLDASMRVRFRPEFADLQRKAFSLDSKIARSIASSTKYRRHEEKLALKLAQFEAWLKAMEDDVSMVESMPAGEEQTIRLAQLLSSCISHQRLVGKLERLNVQNRDHVVQLCQRYYAIMSRLRRHNIEEGSLPLHVRTLVQAAPTQSQLSISSLASSEVMDRPESVLSASSSVDVGVASAESETPLEKSIGEIRRRLHLIIQSYNDGPKPLPVASSDYNLLLSSLEDISGLFVELPQANDARRGALENSLLHLQEHLNEIKSQMQQEIEEEVSLSEKEKEILLELSKLEQRVKSREVSDHNIIYDLDQLQTQMDLLRMIRSQPRRFVESDLIDREGSPSGKTRQKRKVLVMVTNTVTTIIQVVEERLLTIEAHSRDPVLQEKLALVKTNLRKLEEEASSSLPELSPGTSAAEQSHSPHLETETPAEMLYKDVPKNEAFAAAVVGVEQALDLAEDVNLENCDDQHVLSESLSLLERQQSSMDALSDIAEELSKSGYVEYIDTISALQERLNSVKMSLADRLSELRAGVSVHPVHTAEEEVLASHTKEGEFEKLAEDVRKAIDSAESIAFAEHTDLQLLNNAKQLLAAQEPSLSILADVADEKAKSGDADYIDIISSLTEQFNSVKYAIEDRLDQSGLEVRFN